MSADFYWCEVVLSAQGRDILLRGSHTTSPRSAVRWLRSEANRLANLMDPPLDAPWLSGIGSGIPLMVVTGEERDAPEELRGWAADLTSQASTMRLLAEGNLFHFRTHDGQTGVSLSARPMPVSFATALRQFTGMYVGV